MGPIHLWDSCRPSLKTIITAPAVTFISPSMLLISVTIFLVFFFFLPGGGGGGCKLLALLPSSTKTRGSLFV